MKDFVPTPYPKWAKGVEPDFDAVPLKTVECPKDYYGNFIQYQRDVHSQNGEDGILEEIFKRLKITKGTSCEFGAWNGYTLSNTFNLVKQGWSCLMIESHPDKYKELLVTAQKQSTITPLNMTVCYEKERGYVLDEILQKNKFDQDFDLLSIDVDSCDYQIWKSLENFKPKVVVIEHSGLLMDIIHHPLARYKRDIEGTTAFPPMKRLGEEKGYTLLCDTGNLIFIRNDLKERIK
jgi:hypothetical protein